METFHNLRYIKRMTQVSHFTTPAPQSEAELTDAERHALAESIARARAQLEAGETVSGEAVFEWLASWGTEQELPAPKPATPRA